MFNVNDKNTRTMSLTKKIQSTDISHVYRKDNWNLVEPEVT